MSLRVVQLHAEYSTNANSGENSTVKNMTQILNKCFEVKSVCQSTKFITSSKRLQLRSIIEFLTTKELHEVQKADVVIFHNRIPFFGFSAIEPLLEKATVIRVWHNYRNVCIAGVEFRDNEQCNLCSTGRLKRAYGVIHKCYRNNRMASIAVTVDEERAYKSRLHPNFHQVAISRYMSMRVLNTGYPQSSVHIIPNYVEPIPVDNSISLAAEKRDFLFVGRLTEEKGVVILLKSWSKLPRKFRREHKLHIIGVGPLLKVVKEEEAKDTSITAHGSLMPDQIGVIAQACFVGLSPAIWEEPFGKTIVEYQSMGLRQISTDKGGLSELIMPEPYGIRVKANDSEELSNAIIKISQGVDSIELDQFHIRHWFNKNNSLEKTRNDWLNLIHKLHNDKV